MTVFVNAGFGYAFPYLVAEANAGGSSSNASGFTSLNESGSGPSLLNFVMRMSVPGPGDYKGIAYGEGAGLPPTYAPDYPFSFSIPNQSPVSAAKGEPSCEADTPTTPELIKTAVLGAVANCPICSGILGKAGGVTGNLVDKALDAWDSLSSVRNVFNTAQILDDPPDSDYTQIAPYAPAPILAVPSGLSASQTTAVANSFTAFSNDIGYLQAFVTSYERAWGAIDANSVQWYDAQMKAAATYAGEAAIVEQQMPAVLTAAQNALFPTASSADVTTDDLSSFQNWLLAGNTDTDLATDLGDLGLSPAEVTSVMEGQATVDASSAVGENLSDILTGQDDGYLNEANLLNSFVTFEGTAVTTAPPVITGVSPDSGLITGGSSITITGSNLANVSEIQFGSDNPPVTDPGCSDTSCTVTNPAASVAETVDVTASNSGGPSAQSASDRFTYQLPPPPTVTSVSPDQGYIAGGDTVTVSGTNLALTSEIDFGSGNPGSNLTCTDSSCTVTSPTGVAGAVDVTAVTPGGTSATNPADSFTYLPPPPAPSIIGVSPGTGSEVGGTEVTITGTSMSSVTEVDFGDSNPGTGLNCTGTSCTVVSPSGSVGPVDLTATNPGGTSAVTPDDQFTYVVPPPPTVTAVSPKSGSTLGGDTITVTGTNLGGASEIDFGQTSGSSLQCSSNTTCTVQDPAAAAGPVDVTVTTPGGTSTAHPRDVFTYIQAPPPTVTGVSPASGPYSGGGQVTITGTNLSTTTEIDFGPSNPAPSVDCPSDTSCTTVAPPGPPGAVDVTVVGAAGSSATNPSDQYTYLGVGIAEYQIPSNSATGDGHLVQGIGGKLWFTAPYTSMIGTISADGVITETPTASPNSFPVGITEGSDERMWYAEQTTNDLVAVDAAGNQTIYPVSSSQSDDLLGVASGPDGRIWFTMINSGEIGAMTTSGVVTYYPLPNSNCFPRNIVQGPDGRMWFTEFDTGVIGAITTSGQITEYPLSDPGAAPWTITVGPDQRLWFTEAGTNEIGALTTDGQLTEYPLSSTNFIDPSEGPLVGIAAGTDGKLWFAASEADSVGSITTSGVVTEYSTPQEAAPGYITAGYDESGHSTLWFTQDDSASIGEILTGGAPSYAPVIQSASPPSGSADGGTVVTISGTGFTGTEAVQFAGASASAFTVEGDSEIVATTPPGPIGQADIDVTTPGGSVIDTGGFTYTAPTCNPVEVTSAAPGPATVGDPFDFEVTTCSSSTPKIKATGLPKGLALVDNGDGSASISGTPLPKDAASYAVSITAAIKGQTTATQNFTMTVDQTATFTNKALTTVTAGTSIATPFVISTKYANPAPSLSASGLPPGVTLTDNGNGTGWLGGTPAASDAGVYPVTITAANAAGTVLQSFSLTVEQVPSLSGPSSATGSEGSAIVPVTINYAAYPTVKLKAARLPKGLTLTNEGLNTSSPNEGTAVISGTPASKDNGVYDATVTAINKAGAATPLAITFAVDSEPVFRSKPPSLMTVGTTLPTGSAAINAVTEYGYPFPALTASGLPKGVTLVDNGNGTATFTGTPTSGTGGPYSVTLTADNSAGITGFVPVTKTFSLNVYQPPALVGVRTSAVGFTPGVALSSPVTFSATGFPAPTIKLSGLPKGLAYTETDGTVSISGTPAANAGSTTAAVTASSKAGTAAATISFTDVS